MNYYKEITALIERVDSIRKFLIVDSRLHYVKVEDCPSCKHATMQYRIGLTDGSGDGYECLTCGKIWHKPPEIVEYKKKE